MSESPTSLTTTMMAAPRWSSATWDAVKQAVHQETQRTKIAQKILPIHIALPRDATVPSEEINKSTLEISEGSPTSIIETSVPFTMSDTQVQPEEPLSTALTLATKAANLIATAQDLIVFQGNRVINRKNIVDPPGFVRAKLNGNNGKGLLGERDIKSIQVPQLRRAGRSARASATSTYGENTFAKVAQGIAELQSDGHYGPYALVLHSNIYADTFAPLQDIPIMPADRIKPLVEKGFYGTGTLPERYGVLLSLGGNSMDLVVGLDAVPEFISYTPGNNGAMYSFQVRERFTLRLKDKNAIRRLEFQ
jgi:uncharacterized linocin/CFP29 family protein